MLRTIVLWLRQSTLTRVRDARAKRFRDYDGANGTIFDAHGRRQLIFASCLIASEASEPSALTIFLQRYTDLESRARLRLFHRGRTVSTPASRDFNAGNKGSAKAQKTVLVYDA
jgi:hypothetical protein